MLSILITHYKTLPLLKLCLRSIREHCSAIGPKEIFVLDSEAEEETAECVREFFPEVRYVPFRVNVGYARLVNEGLRLSRGEYILIANADVVFRPSAVERLMAFFNERPEVGIVAPQLLKFDGTVLESCFRFYTPGVVMSRRTFLKTLPGMRQSLHRFLLRDVDVRQGSPIPVDWVQGSALLTRREAVNRVGPFDERFFMYFEDVDWCRRFWENGYAVFYLPEAQCYHWHGRPSRRFGAFLDPFLNKHTRIHITSACKYFLKYGFTTPRFGV